MFHFPGCPLSGLWIHPVVTGHDPRRVPPFGYPWINAYVQLPKAFRSLSRPSSAISAMASTLRSYLLDLAMYFRLHVRSAILLRLFRDRFAFFRVLLLFLCSFQGALRFRVSSLLPSAFAFGIGVGGLEWTRTTDLSLIRRVL